MHGNTATPDWRTALPERTRRPIRAWLYSIAAMTLGVLVVGGITRLTMSGLSIVEWAPIMGVIPPLNEAQWQAAFDQYRQFPEYQQLRQGMSLREFQFIFFWEYLHRLLARTIGIVFLVPFIYFAVRRRFNGPLFRRALVLFALGGMQGVMGWFMVSSGLVDQPSVSHYRLAAHLSLAFIIFGYAIWLARELRVDATSFAAPSPARSLMLRGLAAIGVLLGVQIVWGAFVAGLDAGFIYNTFPLMGGSLVPAALLPLEPAWLNFFTNPVAVQWLHRVIGTVLAAAVIAHFIRVTRAEVDSRSRTLNLIMLGMIVGQYALGVITLIYHVPVSLGVLHQVVALIITGVWVVWLHHALNIDTVRTLSS